MGYDEECYKNEVKILKANHDLKRYMKEAREAIIDNEYSKAELYLKETLVTGSDNVEVESLLGVTEELIRNKRVAQNYYRVVLAFDSTYTPAENSLERLFLDNNEIYSIDLGEWLLSADKFYLRYRLQTYWQ